MQRISKSVVGEERQMDSNAGLGTVLIRAKSVYSLVPLWSPAFINWSNKGGQQH